MNDRPVVALGDRRYAVERRWAELPGNERLELISQLAVDKRGRVYVNRRKDKKNEPTQPGTIPSGEPPETD